MEIGVRELRERTSQLIDAVQAGERVILFAHGQPVADIVPHEHRARWVSGDLIRRGLSERSADAALSDEMLHFNRNTLGENG